MINFVHLHVHTTYSFMDGYGTAQQTLDRVEELGHKAIGLTEHGNIWSHVPFWIEAKKRNNIKIIPGIEFYITDAVITEKIRQRYHITVFAKNNKGLENIHKLVSISNFEGFYYKPRIDINLLNKYNEGLIVLSGCMGNGFLLQHLNDEVFVDNYLKQSKNIWKDDFYIEVSAQERVQKEINQIISLADDHKIKIVTTSDSHFPKLEDHSAQDLKLCIATKSQYNDPQRLKMDDMYFMFDGREAEKRGKAIYGNRCKEFYDATLEIADKCNITRTISKQKAFNIPKEINLTPVKLFDELIESGVIFKKLREKSNWSEYEKRIKYERDLVIKKDYINYFLVLSDLIIWAKQHMLVGAARGSSAGSIIAYLLRITEVDPLKFDLMFERFIDITRYDPPDIDCDFPDEKRGMVVQYLIDKYGEKYTSLIGVISNYKPKVAIWDTRRVYNLPWDDAKKLAELTLDRSSGDARAAMCLEDTFKEFDQAKLIINKNPQFKQAIKLEGQARQTGVHAAAVIISEQPLAKMSGFVRGKQQEKILSLDKYGAEALGLLKIDILGLKQLTILENILHDIDKSYDWLYNLPLDNKKVFSEIFDKHRYWGIFQFEGDSCRIVARQVRPDTFMNICEISALARPGALHCGGTTKYIDYRSYEKGFDRKTKKEAQYYHESLKEIAGDTYGVIIYQEQVLTILRKIGKMPWDDANQLRRAMSKSYGVEFFNKFKNKFLKGAKENEINEETATLIWDNICMFGSWAFNKSHSVSYGLIGYWCAYLKAHYPAEFYVRTLQKENDDMTIKKLLREWNEIGGKFIVLDFEKSKENFSLHESIIYGGFSNIKGIGIKAAEKIINNKPYNDSKVFRKTMGKKGLEILKCLNLLKPMPIGSDSNINQIDIFAGSGVIKDKFADIETKLTVNEIAPWSDLYPIGDKYKKLIEKKGFKVLEIADLTENHTNVIMVVKILDLNLRSIKETSVTQQRKGYIKDSHLDKFLNILTEDDTESIILGIDRYQYNKIGKQLFDYGIGTILAVKGKKIPGYRKIRIEKYKVLYTIEKGDWHNNEIKYSS